MTEENVQTLIGFGCTLDPGVIRGMIHGERASAIRETAAALGLDAAEVDAAILRHRAGAAPWPAVCPERGTAFVLAEVAAERERQTIKHGDQSHLPDGTGPYALGNLLADERHRYATGLARWAKARTDAASQSEGNGTVTFEHILTEEWAEAMAESDPVLLRAELLQVAAVAVQWAEAIDLRTRPAVGGS